MVKKHVKTTKEKKGGIFSKGKFYSYYLIWNSIEDKTKIKKEQRLKNNDSQIKRIIFIKKFSQHWSHNLVSKICTWAQK